MNMLTFFEFTEEDLRSNQHGLITPRQKQFLHQYGESLVSSHRSGWPMIIFFMLLGGGIILAMNLSNESTRRALLADPINLVILCASIPLILGVYGLGAMWARRTALRFSQPDMKVAEGEVRWDDEYSDSVGRTYILYVGKTKFKFGEDLSHAFPSGRRGRIFYCEGAQIKLILSHELLN